MWITMSLEKAGWRRDTGPAMFEAEAAGLNAMHATGTIRVPKPLKVSMPSLLGSVQ
jgi:fructosamine-3-kinase